MKKVLLSAFTKLRQDELATYIKNVVALMLVDPLFESLMPQILELKTAYDAYTVALTNNVNGGRVTTIEKDKCKRQVTTKMTSIALLVDLLANGDESIILAAGFDTRSKANDYTSLDAPNVLKLINETKTGLVTVQLSKVLGATNYGIEKRIVVAGENTPWENGEYSSSLKFQLSNLESGKIYQFHFRAIGNKGLVSPWSSVVEVLVS